MTIRRVVLAVDDDPRVLDAYQAILESRYEVLTAPDGRAALEILQARTVDLVLLDMLMPGLSGLGVLEALKRLGIETNVVMVSGMNDTLSALEALLFSTQHPLTAGRLGELLECSSTRPIRRAIKALNEQYEQSGRAFRVEQVAGGYQLLTLPQFNDQVNKLHQKEHDAKLTKAALETLAIIAYKQPILRAEIESMRGVACG